MKAIKNIITAVCAVLFLAVQTAFPVLAEGISAAALLPKENSAEFYSGLSFGQSDWTALCRLRLYGSEGAEEYLSDVRRSAEELIDSEGFVRPTELQRAAIILGAAGKCPAEIANAAVYDNTSLDRQGFNAYIWGLIAANSTHTEPPENALNTKESLAEHILSKQLTDGGFALKGTAADTDITAAAIYALAPLREDEEIAAALQRAEQALSSLQLENGGFMTIGVENCESAAQAVLALTALGYGEEDSRVSAALAAMEEYFRGNGFAHLPEGDVSGVATAQAQLALTSLELMQRGESLFSAPEIREESAENGEESSVPEDIRTEKESSPVEQPQQPTESRMTGDSIKLVIVSVLAAAGVTLLLIFFVTGRKKTALLWAGILSVLAAGAVMLVDIRTPEEYYADRSESGRSDGITVTVSVDCGEVLSRMDSIDPAINPPEVIPEDGVILYPCEVSVPEGGSALDALIAAARGDRVQVDYRGTSYGAYIGGIGHVYEFGFGAMSGWLYRVNGEYPQCSAGAYILSEGDVVEFVYTVTG